MKNATQLLHESTLGAVEATDQLLSLLYEELRSQASRLLRSGSPNSGTLQPTVLVHEAYLKLIGQRALDYKSHTHFRAISAVAMRHILVDYFRQGQAAKRGGNRQRVTLSGLPEESIPDDARVDQLEEALQRFEEVDPRAARVVTLLFFGGLSQQEAADEIGVSFRTVQNDWQMARAWLRTTLAPSPGS